MFSSCRGRVFGSKFGGIWRQKRGCIVGDQQALCTSFVPTPVLDFLFSRAVRRGRQRVSLYTLPPPKKNKK